MARFLWDEEAEMWTAGLTGADIYFTAINSESEWQQFLISAVETIMKVFAACIVMILLL